MQNDAKLHLLAEMVLGSIVTLEAFKLGLEGTTPEDPRGICCVNFGGTHWRYLVCSVTLAIDILKASWIKVARVTSLIPL